MHPITKRAAISSLAVPSSDVHKPQKLPYLHACADSRNSGRRSSTNSAARTGEWVIAHLEAFVDAVVDWHRLQQWSVSRRNHGAGAAPHQHLLTVVCTAARRTLNWQLPRSRRCRRLQRASICGPNSVERWMGKGRARTARESRMCDVTSSCVLQLFRVHSRLQ